MANNIFWKNFHFCFFGLKFCHPPKQESITQPHAPPTYPHPPPTSSLLKTFNTLYDLTSDSTSKSFTFSSSDIITSSDDSDVESPPDFATVFASQRFFFSSPGQSNSIIESPEIRAPTVTGGVAVPTYSPDPVADFRRSMEEMIEARELSDERSDFEYLHELLSCYLRLNSEQNHKYIISAFTEILVNLLGRRKQPQSRRRLVL